MFSLQNEIAVVTGASGNLGPIWIGALLDAGAAVLAIDHPEAQPSENLQKVVSRFEPEQFQLFRADILERSALQNACSQCLERFGIPAVLVNNAGIDRPPGHSDSSYDVADIPFEENRRIVDVNTWGLFQVTQIFGTQMVNAGGGSIINIGSLYASVAPDARLYDHIQSDPPFLKPPAYGASKAAVINLTRYLATLWAPHGVRVNALSPGGVLGDQDDEFKRKFCERVPLGRMAVASDLRGPLLFLASPASSYVTGIELVVDGGFTAW